MPVDGPVFPADSSPNTYEKVVDQLLGSPLGLLVEIEKRYEGDVIFSRSPAEDGSQEKQAICC